MPRLRNRLVLVFGEGGEEIGNEGPGWIRFVDVDLKSEGTGDQQ